MMTASGTEVRQRPKEVPLSKVVALFTEHLKRGPWPSDHHCYRLAIDINTIRNSPIQKVKHADKGFAARRATFLAMEKLTHEQLARACNESRGLRLPGLISLEILEKALREAKDALLSPYDPLAGERAGSEWHKPARYLASQIEETLLMAGHNKVSRDKRSRFISVVRGALALAGQGEHEPAAIAAALVVPPL
jgi:hypothetical protein